MNPLLKLITELEEFLKSVEESMIYDLEFFIKREIANPKLQMLSFIYSFEDFKTVVYSIDKNGNTITDVVGLPIKDYENLYADVNYEEFVPYEIEEKEYAIYNKYQELGDKSKMSEYWDFSEEYFRKKTDVFINWFIKCWKIANTNTNTKILSCFSKHDSSGGIDLTSGKFMTDDEIEKVFK